MSQQLQGLQPHSRAANRLLQLGQEYSKLPDSSSDIEFGYASAMSRVIRSEGFTVESLIHALGEGVVIRSNLMGYLEMADARSHHSPLHNKVGCGYCEQGGANPQPVPVDSDDPWGAIARTEMIAEMLPSERREFLGSEPRIVRSPCKCCGKLDASGRSLCPSCNGAGYIPVPSPCPDADKVRDGWGGWLDPMTGKSCPKPGMKL